MKPLYLIFSLTALVGVCLHPLPARDRGPSSITLAEALDRAEAHHPELTVQRFDERAAEARVEQAGLRPSPTLDVTVENALGAGRVQGVRSLETTVQATQTWERGGKRERRIALAGREVDAVVAQRDVLRLEARSAAAVAYVEVLAAQRQVQQLEMSTELARATLVAVEARVREGAASPAEAARARASLASAGADQARGRTRLEGARAALSALWGGNGDEVGLLAGHLRCPDALPTELERRSSLGDHPRLRLQLALVDSRRAAFELARAEAVPDVAVAGGVRYLRDGSDAAFVAGLSVPLVTRNRNQGSIRAARESLAGAQVGVQLVETQLRNAWTAAWMEVAAAHGAALALRRDGLPASEEALALVRRAYEEGHLPLIDVLDAQRSLATLTRELLEHERDFAVALARAEGLTAATFPLTTAWIVSE